MLAVAWRNPVNSLDVSNDGVISPLDPLQVINELNLSGSHALSDQRPGASPYWDASGDQVISPLDALQVINALNAGERAPYELVEAEPIAAEQSVIITVGQTAGTRTYRLQVTPNFVASDTPSSSEDVFALYLVDAEQPDQTLLDRGTPGTTLFTLSASGAEFAPGKVRWDGEVVEIDLSEVADRDTAKLKLQLLNGDGNRGSSVLLQPLSNVVNAEGVARSVRLESTTPTAAGAAFNLASVPAVSDVAVHVENVRYNSATQQYAAELRLQNQGGGLGRTVAVALPGLPSGVTLRNPSGTTPDGAPYINFAPAIARGGLSKNARSERLLVEFDNPEGLLFTIAPEIFAGVNRPPVLGSIDTLTVTPGEKLITPLTANDPDGDVVTFALRAAAGAAALKLPTGILRGNGQLEFTPELDQLGTYVFDVIASDGVLEDRRTITLNVVADPNATTRISGVVKNTGNAPLAGVPIEIAGFSAVTDDEGQFTIALPTMTVPTEAFNIAIPAGDPMLDPFDTGTQQIPFRRARYDVTTGDSVLNPRQNPNLVTSFIDASMVYGSDEPRAAALRTFTDGKLKTSAGDLLPLNDVLTFPDGTLENDNAGRLDPATLFAAGDVRANENVPLLSLQTLLVREHNRLAEEIKAANSSLNDEQIYQEARRMVGAIIQQITYNEYLPLLVGEDAIPAYASYDPDVDPGISAAFSTAAFRLGHTQLFEEILRLDANGDSLPGGPLDLADAFFTPEPVKADGIEAYLRGLAAAVAQDADVHVIDAVRNFLFGPPGAGGMDLAAMNIQRGRDLGLPSYNRARIDFGLPAVTSFSQINSDPTIQSALQTAYGTVDKVDLWVGGIAEDHVADSMVGPLFRAILVDQFTRTRDGDRFWYENEQFTTTELQTIRATTLTGLIERNTSIVGLPANVFTTGSVPAPPVPGGSAATSSSNESRTADGTGNNLTNSQFGSTGSHLVENFTRQYGDGISTPGGINRPNPRAISNLVHDQDGDFPNAAGATGFLVYWGQFVDHDLDHTPGGASDTLKILGNERPNPTGDETYPFVAEKVPLLFGHDVYPGVNNVLARPIYLPVLDVSAGTTIDPTTNTIVQQEVSPGEIVELQVAAGTLQNRNGTMFDGTISITEVPRELTPAALPANLLPDTVVTIQPAGMIFTQPAPLTFPNRSDWPPGTEMDLWSINPVTGEFEDVGDGRVSSDGLRIETISGGVRNSSWHFFARLVEAVANMLSKTQNIDENCPSCIASETVNSQVELHSGAIIETHELVTYSSLGATRGLTLRYDSATADPQPILHFGIDNAVGDGRMLAANLTFTRGGLSMLVDGYSGDGLPEGGFHFWQVPSGTNTIEAALQGDLASSPTGVYDYTLKQGLLLRDASGTFTGTLSESSGTVTVVNDITSQFGAGWQLGGLQRLVENPDGSILLIDGGGLTLRFMPPAAAGESYVSPPGDFTTLIKDADGSYSRTLTDQMVYEFNAAGLLRTVTDRVGNVTEFVYASGLLSEIIDPVGLHTTLTYVNNRVSEIADPAGRVTKLSYDAAGNLVTIEDPDGSQRSFQYDNRHHLTAETDQRGSFEQTFYGFHGRAESSIRKDGTELTYSPLQTRILQPPAVTDSPVTAPMAAIVDPTATAVFVDSNGNVEITQLDQQGQAVSRADSLGDLPTIARNESNLVVRSTDARGYATFFEYDEFGNVNSIDLPSGESAGSVTRLRSGETVTASLDGGVASGGLTADVDVYTLDAEAGEELLITVQENSGFNNLQAIVYAPDGTRLDDANTNTGHAFTFSNLASSGTYTIVIRAANGSETGNYNLTATVIDSAVEADNVDLISGETVAASLTIGDIDAFTIDAQAGNELLVTFQEVGNDFNNLQGIVYAPDGTRLDDATTSSGHAFTFSNLVVTGTYTVVVRAANGIETGNYNLTATVIDSEVEADNIDLASGETVDASLTIGDIDSFTIDAQAGDELLVNFQEVGNDFNNLQGFVYAPDGTRLDDANTGTGHAFTFSNLVVTGTYTVVIRAANGAETGDYTIVGTINGSGSGTRTVTEADPREITAAALTAPADTPASVMEIARTLSAETATTITDIASLAVNEPDTSEMLTPGNRYDGQLQTAGEEDELLIELAAGGDLLLSVSASYQIEATVIDPAGNSIATETGTRFVLDVVDVTVPGDYRIMLRAANGNSTGNYRVSFAKLDTSFYESLGQPQTFTYDPTFRQSTSSVDELGHATLYEVDPVNGNRLAMRQVIGQVDDASNGETDDLLTTFTYTPQGLVDTITDPQGRVTDFDYTLEALVSSITFAVGTADEASQSFEYDAAGNPTAIVDENGNRTEFQYDELNRLTQMTEADPDGAGPLTAPLTTFTYDARGNLIETSDAAGSTTINQYDALNRLVLSRDEFNHETRFTYDHNGNIVMAIDANGNPSRYRYDARDRRVETLDPDGGATTFQYDADNNLISLTDPNGNATTFTYDGRDRLMRESDPLSAVTRYSYDAVDNLIRQVDRDGRTTEFAYDDLDRLVMETWLEEDQSVAHTIEYAYDKTSNLLAVVDDFSSLAFAYDARNRVTSVDNAGTLAGSGLPNVVLGYAYEDVGNVLSVAETIDGSGGATTAYQYDGLNRMSSVQQSGGGANEKLVDLVYNGLGQFDQISRYSDLSRDNLVARSDYEYDGLNRLTSLDHSDATDAAIAFYDFEYDPASRITAITDIDGRTDYTYDDRDQLTAADRDVADPRSDENYTYDANGNRIDSHLHGDGYVTGPANRLLSDGTFDYAYDAEGNMILRTEIASGDYREFEYDHRNRLTRVTDFSSGGIITQAVTYTYDALDRRIERTVDADGAGSGSEVTEHFVYDGDNVLLDFVDADGGGSVEQPQLTARYLFGPQVDQVLAREDVAIGQTRWLLTDHLGSVKDVLSDIGIVLNHITFNSLGNVLSQTDPMVTTRYLFTGRELDIVTELYYYRARFYDANLGRFIGEDPIRMPNGDHNLYRYSINDPINRRDPFGNDSLNLGVGGRAAFLVGIGVNFGIAVPDTIDDVFKNSRNSGRSLFKSSLNAIGEIQFTGGVELLLGAELSAGVAAGVQSGTSIQGGKSRSAFFSVMGSGIGVAGDESSGGGAVNLGVPRLGAGLGASMGVGVQNTSKPLNDLFGRSVNRSSPESHQAGVKRLLACPIP